MSKKDANSTDVVKAQDSTLANQVDFGEFAGMGFENQTSDDVAIPFLNIIQHGSPQRLKNCPQYIEGANAGDVFNSVTNELLPNPACIVPCTTEHVYVEWIPREEGGTGGGFVGVHALDSEVVLTAKQNATERNKLKTESGNDLVETFQIYALLLDSPLATESISPIVIGFTKTKIKVYKQLMTKLKTIKSRPPLFAFRLAISTFEDMSKNNEPFQNFVIDAANGSLVESMNLPGSEFETLLHEGKALVEAINSGTVKAAHESTSADAKQQAVEDEPF